MSDAKLCPLLKEPCIEHKCKWYVHLYGQNPQTGDKEDRYDCTMVFMPILTIECTQSQRQTGAAVESFRNEMVAMNEKTAELMLAQLQANSRPALLKLFKG